MKYKIRDLTGTFLLPFFPPVSAVLQMALSWYLSLDSQSQRYVGWGFLAFTCLFVSGLWTLKIGLAVLLLLMKPVSPSQTPVQKQKKKQRDADGRAFSTDPRLSAFQVGLPDYSKQSLVLKLSIRVPSTSPFPQRIADSVTTYGNVPASKSTSALDTSPSPRASSSTPSPPPVQKESDLVAMPEPAAMPDVPRRLPSNPSPPPPLPPTLRSQTDTAIIAAPLPNPHDANHRAASPSPSSSTEAGQWQRKPSGSFHRIEVAKKFVNRKFGGAGSRATSGTGVLERSVSSPAGCDLDAEQPPQKEVLRESIPTEHGWVLEDRRPAI